ncbi:MAG: hypothetical protein CME07_05850 [Gemmatimonadetes bacterium]|nr:hypothetical protein [Gemmatimonadota bacterium]
MLLLAAAGSMPRAAPVHTTWLWHMHQPIYWPERSVWNGSAHEFAHETITLGHSQNDVFSIFDKDDRVHAYQDYPRTAISSVLDLPDAGAQVSFAGSLIGNIRSLAAAGWNGGRYAWNWSQPYRDAHGWTTSGGRSRLDLVLVAYHHSINPLVDEAVFRRMIQAQKAVSPGAWGDPAVSAGFFPAEMCFSERMIPVLASEGIAWSIVPDIHIARACADYPYDAGQDQCDPPNLADQWNPAQGFYNPQTISRGVTVKVPPSYGLRPHRAEFVDPETGIVSSIVVVPASNAMGWNEGYGLYGTGEVDAVAPYNDPAHPTLVLFAHDGDNAWAGGYSYYNENVTQFAHAAAASGYEPTTVAEYLADHPVAADDVVHVEDGGWVNADGDFGSPQFINWNWPLVDAAGFFDIPNGWAEDERNWAVLTAAVNRVLTAEEVTGPPDIDRVVDPTLPGTTDIDKAWHFLLAGHESGYMYYGTALDMEVKPTLAANRAMEHAAAAMAGGADLTGPTVWIPQRLPWNPGGKGGGALWGYPSGEGADMTSGFHVWTFVDDLSGVAEVSLLLREDLDGANSPASTDNETHAGGPEVGAWQAFAMTQRDFPAGNVHNDPGIDFFVMPNAIADEYWFHVSGFSDALLDYRVEAVDSLGNRSRSPIQHVYVGTGGTGGHGYTLDGQPDPGMTPAASCAGVDLYAEYDGRYLYLAAPGVSQTTGVDHFLMVAREETAGTRSAPWAKAGTAARWDLYLGNENDNDWSGWFDANENLTSSGVSHAAGSYLEGVVDTETAWGSAPTSLRVCFAAYASADGGSLDSQTPCGNGDGDLPAPEWIVVQPGVTAALPGDPASAPAGALTLRVLSGTPSRGSIRVQVSFAESPGTNRPDLSADLVDVSGRIVEPLHRGPTAPDIVLEAGSGHLPSGVYFVRAFAGGMAATAKIVLVR